MYTQPDVDTCRDAKSQCSGFTAIAIPEANGSQTGVSVGNAPAETKQWYVMRISYGRAQKANDFLSGKGFETYLPLHTIYKEVAGKRMKTRVPLLPNFLFIHDTLSSIRSLLKLSSDLDFVSFYYNHFTTSSNGKNPPLTVSDDAMQNFIRLTAIDNEHILLIDNVNGTYRTGDQVCVTAGPFKGVEGRVAKITGQKRVIVELLGLCSVATAYIPKAFLCKK